MNNVLSGWKRKYTDNEPASRTGNKATSSKGTVFKNLNAENATQNICLLDSQVLMLTEKRGHNVYFVCKFWLWTAWD
jgi:hypothetical protein